MATGLSPKLPLSQSDSDGIKLNKTIRELVLQNVKMVLLTSPGERASLPEFGVGLRRYLFRELTINTIGSLDSRIRSQFRRYLSGIKLDKLKIDSVLNNPDLIRYGDNFITISISYTIAAIGASESLSLDITDSTVEISSNTLPI